jgi:hypothetical protein
MRMLSRAKLDQNLKYFSTNLCDLVDIQFTKLGETAPYLVSMSTYRLESEMKI